MGFISVLRNTACYTRPNLNLQFCQMASTSNFNLNNYLGIFYHFETSKTPCNPKYTFNFASSERFVHNDVSDVSYVDCNDKFSEEEKQLICKNMIVVESFINEKEEDCLLKEIEPYMKRLRYEFSHWDNAIHGYRETERLKWNEENTKIIDRVRNFAFPPGSAQLHYVHILDLAENGYIKPHIDAVRFCGNTIAGLSLLTDSVMRLVHDKDKTKVVDVLLKRRSLYVMRDTVRYDYTHEILAKEESKFQNQVVEKKRRISVICRNEPTSSDEPPVSDSDKRSY
ncbi:alpha-ketoglutarate-dependent dioxygenase alkB homolog 7, mitochondrial [Macrosteles quadrilineatus]|uniref:alpha-ketoglutarate-dependent dioxygenase alkB homolog 7, mitochondrial n=1 Tax=Macrosteles quadrilineatus TaxID=74068 RepID=UPI0023E28A2E|nr:alpha-ketoglutarate-dependent dioxygenase alkB homolog 7, mitochondrial [Macrosteles quadrilineatus]